MVYLTLLATVALLSGALSNRYTARVVRARAIDPEWLDHLRWELERR